jgi:outer membrane protein OmpA-like peptidoglycan-associated protein
VTTTPLRILLACVIALGVACGGDDTTSSSASTSTGGETSTVDPSDVHLDGDHIVIDQHIMFAFDSDEILPESNPILDHLATFIANHRADVPTLRIIGHTDAQGGADHNLELSERRAAAVAAALRARSVSANLEPAGRGQSEPLCTEQTDACHERNRRVELVVVVQ